MPLVASTGNTGVLSMVVSGFCQVLSIESIARRV